MIVVGNSIGGSDRRRDRGAEQLPGSRPWCRSTRLACRSTLAPAADFSSLTMDQVAELAYYEPDKFRIDLDQLPEPAKAAMAANRAALAV